MPAVSVRALRKSYGPLEAVADIAFQVERGEVFGLLGPNGAGKTTTVEILEGFRSRDGGEVSVLGFDPKRRERAFRERIGIVLQELAVEPMLTVREVLTRNAAYYPKARPVEEVIELVGLKEKRNARVKTLSGGQQRRLDVGLGIIGNPELLFLDEPTTGFDPSARRGAWDLVRGLAESGTTIILTTHYMDEAEALADRVAVIARGCIVASGTPSALGERETSEATIRFRLPEGVAPPPLSATLAKSDAGYELSTRDEIAVLYELSSWSLANEVPVVGLSVEHLSLEDVYLRLTGAAAHEHEPGT